MTKKKDWTGNSRSAHAVLGARNYAQNERGGTTGEAIEEYEAKVLLMRCDYEKYVETFGKLDEA